MNLSRRHIWEIVVLAFIMGMVFWLWRPRGQPISNPATAIASAQSQASRVLFMGDLSKRSGRYQALRTLTLTTAARVQCISPDELATLRSVRQ